MSSFIKIKPQILYAPMLATFGGGSVRGFGRGIGGGPLTVDQVFSTDIWTGDGASETITSGLDMTEGGLVWIKGRNVSGYNHTLYDTERSGTLISDTNQPATGYASEIASYNNNGYTVSSGAAYNNFNNTDYCAWSWRKAPKFFDIQVWDGNGVAGREISHNLDCEVGMIVIKLLNVSTRDWVVYHRGADSSSPENYFVRLHTAGARTNDNGAEKVFNNVAPTSTKFTLGNNDKVNGNYNNLGWKYVAYLFAHETGDDARISCGSYAGNGSSTGPAINLGFQPQFILYKNATSTDNWEILDSVRGVTTNGNDRVLRPDIDNVELITQRANFLSNGWQPKDSGGAINSSGDTYIYMAIRAEG